MAVKHPKPPHGTGPSGGSLWDDVLTHYELEQHELTLLRQAVRTADQLDLLAEVVLAEGPMLDGKAHPALVESRQLRLVMARLVAALRLPSGDEDDQELQRRRPQRRGGVRGVYSIGGA